MVDVSTVIVREMRGEDVEPLAEALQWSFRQIDKRWQEMVAKWREVFVAEVEGQPVGTVSVNERPEQPKLIHLFALDVSEPLRNRGIGTQLVDYVEAEAQRRGLGGVYLEVAVSNVLARRLYERLGYAQDKIPFQNSWQYTHEDGMIEERVELMIRMVKRF